MGIVMSNLSPEQRDALNAVLEWHADGSKQVFRLFGYAGTGKTTIAIDIARALGANHILFGAFTGKAAYVMAKKGCLGATTIHRLIYTPSGRSHERLANMKLLMEKLCAEEELQHQRIEQLRAAIEQETEEVSRPAFKLNMDSPVYKCDMLIIDECSMVDGKIGADLLSFGKPILVLGDPAQLPPVRGAGFFTEQTPDIMLTKIHRQAEGNPIIAMATKVRHGDALTEVQPMDSLTLDMICDADQVIVGRNATRRSFNAKYRRDIIGVTSPLPVAGDKLVCLRNNHELGLLNGGQWTVEEAVPSGSTVTLSLIDADRTVATVAHTAPFLGEEVPPWLKRDADEFDYGYAMTCHKAQGSQWDNVLIMDESASFNEHASRWLYTAITRAAKKVTVLR